MKVQHLVTIALILLTFPLNSQSINQEPQTKLVVGIVVDQMRNDYLTRYWNKFGEDGFKRLINEGFIFKNNHFNYIPTYTGPGHASVFTGTSPGNHGIIGNDWYDKFSNQLVYCVSDPNVLSVGTTSDAGKMSPHRMKTTTVADQNRLQTQMRGKTIGIALKDRGAILPAGHTANAAYWFHGYDEGNWISSSFYMDKLPKWVNQFNESDILDSYFEKTWDPIHALESYTESGPDDNLFEGGFKGKDSPTFPYNLRELKAANGNYELIKSVAFGNDFTTDFAIAAIYGEELGKDNDIDFLTLSFSSTDYIGHNFGVNSIEIHDTYLRLDLNIARLLKELDENIGKDNYVVFLTSDHGAADVPSYLKSVKIPAGNFHTSPFRSKVLSKVKDVYGENDFIANISNNQIFFNYEKLEEAGVVAEDLEILLSRYILQIDMIDKVIIRSQLHNPAFSKDVAVLIQNGFDQKRSGDIIYILEPAVIPTTSLTGTTHGSGLTYDTHAPLIFYGNGIKKGGTTLRSEIIDIAPTIAVLLGISFPNGTSGSPLDVMLIE